MYFKILYTLESCVITSVLCIGYEYSGVICTLGSHIFWDHMYKVMCTHSFMQGSVHPSFGWGKHVVDG